MKKHIEYKTKGTCSRMITVELEDGVITDCKFNTFGCGSAIATSSMATEMIKGKPVEEALQLSNKAVVEALKESVKYKVERFTGMIVDTINVKVMGVKA